MTLSPASLVRTCGRNATRSLNAGTGCMGPGPQGWNNRACNPVELTNQVWAYTMSSRPCRQAFRRTYMPRNSSSIISSTERVDVMACSGKDQDVREPEVSRSAMARERSSATVSNTGITDCAAMRNAVSAPRASGRISACTKCQTTSPLRLASSTAMMQFACFQRHRVLPGFPLQTQWKQPSESKQSGKISAWPPSGTQTSPPRPLATISSGTCVASEMQAFSLPSNVRETGGFRRHSTSQGQAFTRVNGALSSTVHRASSGDAHTALA
mmetsp:Transcript_104004/g.201542  ORF Transcript_104004/g.201542 Transcript_104004/m.201542 type:complete len:269 (-) Transcript_104004:343-1149(-)